VKDAPGRPNEGLGLFFRPGGRGVQRDLRQFNTEVGWKAGQSSLLPVRCSLWRRSDLFGVFLSLENSMRESSLIRKSGCDLRLM
jgi:hypothetical protein